MDWSSWENRIRVEVDLLPSCHLKHCLEVKLLYGGVFHISQAVGLLVFTVTALDIFCFVIVITLNPRFCPLNWGLSVFLPIPVAQNFHHQTPLCILRHTNIWSDFKAINSLLCETLNHAVKFEYVWSLISHLICPSWICNLLYLINNFYISLYYRAEQIFIRQSWNGSGFPGPSSIEGGPWPTDCLHEVHSFRQVKRTNPLIHRTSVLLG